MGGLVVDKALYGIIIEPVISLIVMLKASNLLMSFSLVYQLPSRKAFKFSNLYRLGTYLRYLAGPHQVK